MSSCVWPKQEAVDAWFEKHITPGALLELKEAVTAERLRQQRRADELEAQVQRLEEENRRLKAVVEAARQITNDAKIQAYIAGPSVVEYAWAVSFENMQRLRLALDALAAIEEMAEVSDAVHSEGYPEDWLHAIVHVHPPTNQIHCDGPDKAAVRAWFTKMLTGGREAKPDA